MRRVRGTVRNGSGYERELIEMSAPVTTLYDEVMTTGIKRRHEPPRIVGDLLSAEIAEKQAARSSTS